MSGMTDRRFFMLTAMVTSIAIAVALWYINSIYVDTHKENEESITEVYTDSFGKSLEFNGLTINPELKLAEYDKRGGLLTEGVRLGDIVDGRMCIVLLSANNCQGCVRNEVSLLNRIAGNGKILYIYDSPVGDLVAVNNIPASRYYEIGDGGLLPDIEKGQELPVLLYVEDGRVAASCLVSNSTALLTREFHKFLKKRLNDDR